MSRKAHSTLTFVSQALHTQGDLRHASIPQRYASNGPSESAREEKVAAMQLLHQSSQDITAISIGRAILCAFCDMTRKSRDEFVIWPLYASFIQ